MRATAVGQTIGRQKRVSCSKGNFVVNGSLVFEMMFLMKVPPFGQRQTVIRNATTDTQDIFTVQTIRLFHISDDPNIKVFEPRPSPSHFDSINGDVVFAISDNLLHNYILPRDCPRVTFYSKQNTTQLDKEKFLGKIKATYVVAVEEKWFQTIKQATLYCYEFPLDNFVQLDKGAGYYISYQSVIPVSMRPINNILEELLNRNVELRVMPTLLALAQEVSESTLQFSLIRMRNAISANIDK